MTPFEQSALQGNEACEFNSSGLYLCVHLDKNGNIPVIIEMTRQELLSFAINTIKLRTMHAELSYIPAQGVSVMLTNLINSILEGESYAVVSRT